MEGMGGLMGASGRIRFSVGGGNDKAGLDDDRATSRTDDDIKVGVATGGEVENGLELALLKIS